MSLIMLKFMLQCSVKWMFEMLIRFTNKNNRDLSNLSFNIENGSNQFQIKQKDILINLYDLADGASLLEKHFSVTRLNVLFVDPSSSQELEFGTIGYPFKDLNTAVIEIYNSLYQNDTIINEVLIAIKEQTEIIMEQKLIFDSVKVIITTYNQNTIRLNANNQAKFIIKEPKLNQKTQRFVLASGLQYNHNKRYDQRKVNFAINSNSFYKCCYFNLYNGILKILNIQLSDQEGQTNPSCQTIIQIISGGSSNQVEFYNIRYQSSLQLLQSQSLSEVIVKDSLFDLQKIKHDLIDLQTYIQFCQNEISGRFILQSNTFQGEYNGKADMLITLNGYQQIYIQENSFTDYSFKDKIKVIDLYLLNHCNQNNEYKPVLVFSSNIFNQTSSLLNKPKFQFNVMQDQEITVSFENNSFLNIYQSDTLFEINDLGNTQIKLGIDVKLENFTINSPYSHFMKVISQKSTVIYIKELNLMSTKLNSFMKIDNFLAQIEINKLTMINHQDNDEIFDNSAFIDINNLKSFQVNKAEISNSVFSMSSFLKGSNINLLKLTQVDLSQNNLNHYDFIDLQKVNSIEIDTINLNANKVIMNSGSKFLNVKNLQCTESSFIARINDIISQNWNQYPLLTIHNIKENNSNIKSCQLEMKNLTFLDSQINNNHIISLSSINTLKTKINITGIQFQRNQINQGSLFQLRIASQSIIIKDLKILTNQGKLLTIESLNPDLLTEDKFNQIVTLTNIQITNNSNGNGSLIDLTDQTFVQIQGENSLVQNNYALSKKGLIYLQNSQLNVTECQFKSNFAYYGGVFYLEQDSGLNCLLCNLSNNIAADSAIAIVKENSYIQIRLSTIQNNKAFSNQLLHFDLNLQKESLIEETDFVNQDSTSKAYLYSQIKSNLRKIFKNFNDFSILIQEMQRNDSNKILMSESKVKIKNCQIASEDQFIKATIMSNLKIQDCEIINGKQKDLFLISINSNVSIEQSQFINISQDLTVKPTFLLKITEQSNLVLTDSSIQSISVPFINVHRSVLKLQNVDVQKYNLNQSFILSKQSHLSIQNSQFQEIRNVVPLYMLKVIDKSEILIKDSEFNKFDSGILKLQNSFAIVNQTKIINNQKSTSKLQVEKGQAIYSLNSNLTVQKSMFENLISLAQGGAIYIQKKVSLNLDGNENITILQSNFSKCSSQKGGAIYTDNTDIQIKQSFFTLNNGSEGGALYLSCCKQCQNKCDYNFYNNSCFNNTALLSGGCFVTDLFKVQNYSNSFYLNNSALYGNNYAAYPIYLDRVKKIDQTRFMTDNSFVTFVSGQTIENPIYFALRDMFNQTVNIENSAIGKISSEQKDLQINIQDQSLSINGIFEFSQTQFVSKPGYSGSFTFITDIIDQEVYQKVYGSKYQELKVNIQLRYCTYGEAIEGYKCVQCEQGTYSLTENAENCQRCPDHAECKYNQINPHQGYWRSSNTSAQVSKCYYAYACPGQTYNSCDRASGYEGILCHECIYDENNTMMQFTRKNKHQCARCPETEENIRTYLLFFFINQGYIFFLTQSYYNNLVHEKEGTILLRIFTTYTQIINLIGSFELNWPTLISSLFEGLGAPAQVTEALISVDCLLKDMKIRGNEDTVMISLLITTLQPFIQFFLSIFIYFFAWVFRVKRIKIRLFVTMTVIYYLIYPKIVKDAFSLFTCTEEIDGKKYLVKNTYIECFGDTHVKLIAYLAVPNMIVWIFGIPILILYFLYRKRKDLDNHDNLTMLGFWYQGCKRNRFFWELLLELKKLMMVSITVDITGMGQSYQAFLILMVLYFYFILSSNLQPYKIDYLNKVSYYSEFAQLCTFAFMMVYFRPSTNIVIDNLIFALLLIMNAMFLLRFAFYLAKFYFFVAKQQIELQKQKLASIFSWFKVPKAKKNFDTIDEQIEREQPKEEIKQKKKKKAKIAQISMYKYKEEKVVKRRHDDDYSDDYDYNQGQRQKAPQQELTKEERIQMKIQSIKMLKEKKREYKRKLHLQDGPVAIKLSDYIKEQKKKSKTERHQQEVKGEEEIKEEQKIEVSVKIKDFNLSKDKHGHLLNKDVLDIINKLN